MTDNLTIKKILNKQFFNQKYMIQCESRAVKSKYSGSHYAVQGCVLKNGIKTFRGYSVCDPDYAVTWKVLTETGAGIDKVKILETYHKLLNMLDELLPKYEVRYYEANKKSFFSSIMYRKKIYTNIEYFKDLQYMDPTNHHLYSLSIPGERFVIDEQNLKALGYLYLERVGSECLVTNNKSQIIDRGYMKKREYMKWMDSS